jgi:predicted nucleic acid-binding protein
MIKHILLDSEPLGLISAPVRAAAAAAITKWTRACLAAGHEIYVPEVIDYELRRELLRAQKTGSVKELDGIKAAFNFLPITSAAMLLAADLWASSRRSGLATADPKSLDIDVILAAQALTLRVPTSDLIVATSNVSHLSRFVPADHWSNIAP